MLILFFRTNLKPLRPSLPSSTFSWACLPPFFSDKEQDCCSENCFGWKIVINVYMIAHLWAPCLMAQFSTFIICLLIYSFFSQALEEQTRIYKGENSCVHWHTLPSWHWGWQGNPLWFPGTFLSHSPCRGLMHKWDDGMHGLKLPLGTLYSFMWIME